MNAEQFHKLSADLRLLARTIPLDDEINQVDAGVKSEINILDIFSYEQLQSLVESLPPEHYNSVKRRWYLWKCSQCDKYLFDLNPNIEIKTGSENQPFEIIIDRESVFEVLGTSIPHLFRSDVEACFRNPQPMIDYLYKKRLDKGRPYAPNSLFIVYHSFIQSEREFLLRCAWASKENIYRSFAANFANINFRRAQGSKAGVIFILEKERGKVSFIIDGLNMKFDKEHWKELDINVDSLWLIGPRAKGGKRENYYHGNFTPQVPDNLIRRYTEPGEIVIDLFMGSGTTLYECETLRRNYIGYDINDEIINHVMAKMDSESPIKYDINKCDVTDSSSFDKLTESSLSKMGKKKADFLLVHPPYWDIIHFTDQACDLSNIDKLDEFIDLFTTAMGNALKYLKSNRHFAIVVGDLYRDSAVVPLGFYLMDAINRNFKCKLKGIVIKDMVGNRAKLGLENLWRYKALKSDYFLFKHEYIFVFRKG